ncbi:50S ribosomal protein L6 [Candidatus Poribacteria bacterium]|nr:50S ribosomal protein L6 [Candidatus Poribacteria bacterium]
MSRIGNLPIQIPDKVQVQLKENGAVEVEGPKGKLDWTVPISIKAHVADGLIRFERETDEKADRALHGLSRSLVANMVTGVSEGFEKKLYVVGVGYRAEIDRQNCLVLNVGYSHPVTFDPPEGITVTVDPPENIDGLPHIPVSVKGIDKQMVGQVAASIRKIKKPEVYKPSKGIRYEGEQVRNKEGKTAV